MVKIGILNDQSGVYADFGGKSSVEAARMAVQDFGGKVLGVPVEIVSADHQNKPDVASSIARQWYDTEKVDAIMELTTSSVALAVQGLSKEKKKITMTTGAATTDLTGKQCSPYGFHWAYDTHALAVGTGGALVENGGNKWFFLTADYAFGYSLEEQTSKFVKSKGGQVRRRRAPSARRHRLLVLPAAGAELRRERDRHRQCRPRYRERHQAGGRVRHHPGRHAPRGASLHARRGEGPRPQGGAGPDPHRGLVLGPERREPRLRQEFMEKTGRMPNMIHVGTYSAVLQYLKAIQKAGTDATEPVAKLLHEMPVEDVFAKNGKVAVRTAAWSTTCTSSR